MLQLTVTDRSTTDGSTTDESNTSASICGSSFRSWLSVGLCSAVLSSSLFAADAPKPSPLDRLKERSVSERWQEMRNRYFPSHHKTEAALPVQPKDSLSERLSLTKEASSVASADKEQPQKKAVETERPDALELPLSGWKGKRGRQFESRIPRPTMVKKVPDPYFSEKDTPFTEKDAPFTENDAPQQTAQAPLITLPDLLESANTIDPLVEPVFKSNDDSGLVPPSPSTELALLQPVAEDQGHTPGEIETIFRPITQIQPYYDYSPTGTKPYEYLCPQPNSVPEKDRKRCPNIRPLPASGAAERHFAATDYRWLPTDLHHKPLYFQDVTLERYGQRVPYGLQPFVSLGKFAVQGIGLPYQLAVDPVWRDIYPLGYYRPGDNAPKLFYQVPINLQAAAVAGGAYTGLIFLFP